ASPQRRHRPWERFIVGGCRVRAACIAPSPRSDDRIGGTPIDPPLGSGRTSSMTVPRHVDSSTATLFDLVCSPRITGIIYREVRLGIADALASDPLPLHELAARCDADERSLGRLLRALIALGVCEQQDDRFRLTQLGTHLAADAQPSLKPWVLFEG